MKLSSIALHVYMDVVRHLFTDPVIALVIHGDNHPASSRYSGVYRGPNPANYVPKDESIFMGNKHPHRLVVNNINYSTMRKCDRTKLLILFKYAELQLLWRSPEFDE